MRGIIKLPAAAAASASARPKRSFDLCLSFFYQSLKFSQTFSTKADIVGDGYWNAGTGGGGKHQSGRHRVGLALAAAALTAGSVGIASQIVHAKELSKTDEDPEASEIARRQPKRLGFRERRIIAYEDRIRAYSTPDKIFRYFATLQTTDSAGNTAIMMTPADFVRSLTPGVRQPEGLGLDSFQRYDPALDCPDRLLKRRPQDSVFRTLGDQALISFSDFVFLLTVLSTPPRQFEIAFRMFDANCDGNLDINDFLRVKAVLRHQTSVGKRHRDHGVTGSTLKPELNSALAAYFFGSKSRGLLSVARMLDFQARLQRELNRIEFDRYNPDPRDCITELSFARLLIAYAGFSATKKRRMLRRVREAFSSGNVGISFNQYAEFSRLLKCIDDVDTALTFHHISGSAIDKATFRHMAISVVGIQLDSHLIDVVFVLFDEDGDGHLSNKEFVSVMKHRLLRGLDKSMDTGLARFLSALGICAKGQLLGWLQGGNIMERLNGEVGDE